MKLKFVLLSTLVLSVKCTKTKTSYDVGQKFSTDSLIEEAEERGRGSTHYSLSFTKTYAGDNYQVITQVSIKDAIENAGAYAAIVAGGPGHTFVTLTYTVLRHAEFDFEIKIYGKPPAFHKIP